LGNRTDDISNMFLTKGPLTKNDLLFLIKTDLTTLNRMIRPPAEAKLIVGAGVRESGAGENRFCAMST
ncbi:MAG: hypothetical protein ACM3X9_03435, partial [Bacillota bacterium]